MDSVDEPLRFVKAEGEPRRFKAGTVHLKLRVGQCIFIDADACKCGKDYQLERVLGTHIYSGPWIM